MASTSINPDGDAAAEARQTAIRNRIISHMNNDHQESLANYLQFYNNVPASRAQSAKLEDLSLQCMIVSAAGTRYYVPFDPPMKTLMDARERTVAMHHESLAGLGKSDITVAEYHFPSTPLHWFMGLLTVWGVGMLGTPSSYEPGGSIFYDRVAVPYLSEGMIKILRLTRVPTLILLVGTHVVEAVLLARKLAKFNVKQFGPLWCKWMLTVLLTGFPTLMAFEDVVKMEAAKKKKREEEAKAAAAANRAAGKPAGH